jgi:hypothetical protein
MQNTDSTKKVGFEAWFRKNHGQAGLTSYRKRILLAGGLIVVLILLIILVIVPSAAKSSRSETYKKVSGSAGLQAVIAYDVRCDKKPCDKKLAFNFNVYIFTENGQQTNVVRPDKDGKVNLALPEGDYVMLIGKQFGRDKQFPQEPLHLKNGELLELKLHYKEGRL